VLALWRRWLTPRKRCRRCGLKLQRNDAGARVRYFVDPNVWAERCAESADADTPFACPHLRDATRVEREERA